MLIECPRCAARYDVAEALIGPAGKSVRCAKCGNVWLARRPAEAAGQEEPLHWPEMPSRPARAEPEAALPPGGGPPAEAPDDRAGDRGNAGKGGFAHFPADPGQDLPAPPRFGGAATIGWLATLVVLLAAAWGAYTYRDAIMQAWPPSERVYLALGLHS